MTEDAPHAHLLQIRDHAIAHRDWGLVRELNAALLRLGVIPDEPPVKERAVTKPPAKRGPGRPRKVEDGTLD